MEGMFLNSIPVPLDKGWQGGEKQVYRHPPPSWGVRPVFAGAAKQKHQPEAAMRGEGGREGRRMGGSRKNRHQNLFDPNV